MDSQTPGIFTTTHTQEYLANTDQTWYITRTWSWEGREVGEDLGGADEGDEYDQNILYKILKNNNIK